MNKKERAEVEKLMNDLDPETLEQIDAVMAGPMPIRHGRAGGDKFAIVFWGILVAALGFGANQLYNSDHLVWTATAGILAAIFAFNAIATFIKT